MKKLHQSKENNIVFPDLSMLDEIQSGSTKLMLFGGKGGVGKTSCAAATALSLSMKGNKILLVSSDPAPSLSDIFQQDLSQEVTKISEDLYAIEINPQQFIDDFREYYGTAVFNLLSSVIPVKREDVDVIPDEIMPGLDELMAMEYLMVSMTKGYDIIVWDTAPTGHTLRLLHLPVTLEHYATGGMKLHDRIAGTLTTIQTWFDKDTSHDTIQETLSEIRQSAEVIQSILSDNSRTEFVPVVIPESLALHQTSRLIDALDEYGISIRRMIINGIVPENDCPFCMSRRRMQQQYIDRFHETYDHRLTISEMPLFPEEICGKTVLLQYAQLLCGK